MARKHSKKKTSKHTSVGSAIGALDAKIKLLAQRMKIIESNEQVIGRTLVSHNKKLKELESSEEAPAPSRKELRQGLKEELRKELKEELTEEMGEVEVEEAGVPTGDVRALARQIEELDKKVTRMRQDLDELRYVMENVNPLEYVTIDQLGELLDRKIKEKKRGEEKASRRA